MSSDHAALKKMIRNSYSGRLADVLDVRTAWQGCSSTLRQGSWLHFLWERVSGAAGGAQCCAATILLDFQTNL
jgi:hypothetical protein